MKLTCRVLRRLKLIYGNIAKTLNPVRLNNAISGQCAALGYISGDSDIISPPIVIEEYYEHGVTWLLSFGGNNPTPDKCIELSESQCFWIADKVMNVAPSLLEHAKKLDSISRTRQGRMTLQELQEIGCSYAKAVKDAELYHRQGNNPKNDNVQGRL